MLRTRRGHLLLLLVVAVIVGLAVLLHRRLRAPQDADRVRRGALLPAASHICVS